MRYIIGCAILLFTCLTIQARLLHVGSGQSYQRLTEAAADAVPGDTIIFLAGIYTGGEYIANLQGTATRPIVIMAAIEGGVIIRGGTNSWQLSDAAYLVIEGFVFEHQSGNGFNIDDGGDYDTPSHHIEFRRCTFQDIHASGNNDLLKMSGVDDFLITQCRFLNGAAGGSGIDMVGCHRGDIKENSFVNMGSNAIQAKGGTRDITIEKNFFQNGGQRSLNLGGSTGLAFFRPSDATFEAAEIHAYSNIFIGSVAPVAFVGCVRSSFVNNTIVRPQRWVFRILQETVDANRFEPCGDNIFRNNLIYKDDAVVIDCNIGPDTAPETFIISNNLWYHATQPANSSPTGLPVTELNRIVGLDPLFNDENGDFSIPIHSPATGAGLAGAGPISDFYGVIFATPPSIGAIEGNPTLSDLSTSLDDRYVLVAPNPAHHDVMISWSATEFNTAVLSIIDVRGKRLYLEKINKNHHWINAVECSGVYFFILRFPDGSTASQKVWLY